MAASLLKSLLGVAATPGGGGNAFLAWLSSYRWVTVMSGSPIGLIGWLRISYNLTTLAVSCLCGCILFYVRYDDLSVNTDVLLHAALGGHTLFVYFVYLSRGGRLRAVSDAMALRFRSFDDALHLAQHHRHWDRADRLSLLLMKTGAVNCLVVFSAFAVNGLLLAPQRRLLFPVWSPLSLDDDASYLLAVLHQLTVFCLYTAVHVCGCGVAIGGAHFVGGSFDALGQAFSAACRARPQPLTGQRLRSCVEMHNAILKVVEEYKAVYDTIIVEVLLFCEVVICFVGFQIVLAIEAKDYVRVAIHVALVAMITLHLFMFCHPNQHITNKNEQFRLTLYNSAWQELDLPLQRCVLMSLRRSLAPVRVSYRGVVQASMPSFLNALKTAFSYVNILLILREVH